MLLPKQDDANNREATASNPDNMNLWSKWRTRLLAALAVVSTALLCTAPLRAQDSDPKALATVRAAVVSEFAASQSDQSIWMYRDHDATPGKDAVYNAVETREGELRRLIELDGKPLSASAERAETGRINGYVGDEDAQAKAAKNAAHDDKQAADMLRMLPNAFVWTVASEDAAAVTLNFRPNPQFNPPDMQARVMGQMGGQMVIARDGNRIRTLRGQLTEDVLIGFGLLGKLNQGGTFDVERRQVAPGHWQITETRVHIGGHALLFKTIGQQEDEVKTDWRPSSASTLGEAARILAPGR